MPSELLVRRLEPDDLEDVARMCGAVFGTQHGGEHYRWKYFENPHGSALTTVAFAGERAVGIMGAIPAVVCLRGRETPFVQEMDSGVEEAHRSLQVFLKMAAKTSELYRASRVEFCYGMGNEFSAGVGMTMFGRRKVSSAPRLARVLDWRAFLRRKLPAPLAAAAGALANAAQSLRYRSSAAVPRGFAIREVGRFDERFDELWSRVKGDYPVMVARTARYLSWRYGDPRRSYRAWCIEEAGGGTLRGYAVTAARGDAGGLTRATVVDLLCARNDRAWVARALIAAALRGLRGAHVVDCWMFPHAHFYPHLRRLGFVPRRAGVMDLTVGPVAPGVRPADGFLMEAASWYLTAGDTDWV